MSQKLNNTEPLTEYLIVDKHRVYAKQLDVLIKKVYHQLETVNRKGESGIRWCCIGFITDTHYFVMKYDRDEIHGKRLTEYGLQTGRVEFILPSQHRQAKSTQVDELGQPLRYRKYSVGDELTLLSLHRHNGEMFSKGLTVKIVSFPPMMYVNEAKFRRQSRYIAARDVEGRMVTITDFSQIRKIK